MLVVGLELDKIIIESSPAKNPYRAAISKAYMTIHRLDSGDHLISLYAKNSGR